MNEKRRKSAGERLGQARSWLLFCMTADGCVTSEGFCDNADDDLILSATMAEQLAQRLAIAAGTYDAKTIRSEELIVYPEDE